MTTADLVALFARIRAVEQRLATAEQERVATAFLAGQIHTLGNALQIVDLASAELVRNDHDDHDRLLTDLRNAAIEARGALAKMISLARPAPRTARGAPVVPIVRAALEALGTAIPFETTVADSTATRLAADEVDALVLAAALDLTPAVLRFTLAERTIDGSRWLELVRHDDRPGAFALELAPPSLAAVVDQLARLGGGELTLSPSRHGHELVIALPVA